MDLGASHFLLVTSLWVTFDGLASHPGKVLNTYPPLVHATQKLDYAPAVVGPLGF